MAVDIKDVIDKHKENTRLWTRMDGDKDLYYLTKYVMKDAKDNTVEGIVNVTLNLPATFAAHVQSALMTAEQQIQVLGDSLAEGQGRAIEEFIAAMFDAADIFLTARGEPTLRSFITEQINMRGRGAARVTTRKDADGFVPEIMPIDTRYLVFETNEQGGFKWAAYTMWRSASSVRVQYPESNASGSEPVSITDTWDDKENVVYFGDVVGATATASPVGGVGAHNYGETPIVYREVPLGSMLKDRDALMHRGESIYFLIRDLIPQLNMLASIAQTINLSAVHGPMEYASSGGPNQTPPEYGKAVGMGRMTSVENAGGIRRIDTGDAKDATRLMQTLLSRMIQAGSLSMTDFGNLNFPLSAVALIQLGEASGQVFLPRLGTKGLLYQDMTKMFIRQVLREGGAVSLGEVGHQRTFDTKILEGVYTPVFGYTPKSPETDAALTSIADAQRVFFDDRTILERTFKVPDVDEMLRRKRIEEAELVSDEVRLYRAAKALLEEGPGKDEVEAQLIANKLSLTLEQIRSGTLEPLPERPKPTTGSAEIVPFPSRRASNEAATELQGQPVPSVNGGGG